MAAATPGTPAAELEAGNDDQSQVDTKPNGPPSLFDDNLPPSAQDANIVVRLRNSRSREATDTYTLYPYQPKPPVFTAPQALPSKYKAVKNMVMQSGYRNRMSPDKPYQMGGWRWVYAYHAGLRKAGRGEPHTILTEYAWAADVTPHVLAECLKTNQFEKERFRRYQRALQEYEKNHVDQENEAIRLGLMPIALSSRQLGVGRGHFPAGNWWLQVTRKMPGLTFYWLYPVTAAPKDNIEVVLDDHNALEIIGLW